MSTIEKLDLRPGDWVRVRTESEILATLDDDGTLDQLPFMPEMLAYCGRRFRVGQRAERTCDGTGSGGGLFRRMDDTVHLVGIRCSGESHGGCQAGCLMFWKEAWLCRDERADAETSNGPSEIAARKNAVDANGQSRDRAWLESTTTTVAQDAASTSPCFRCQATQIAAASCPLQWYKPKQYLDDVRKNHVPITTVIRGIALIVLNKLSVKLTGKQFPNVAGTLKRTPIESLDLQPGEWVTVKSKEAILATLDTGGRNRGMTFENEMIPYCGKRYRVMRRVERIVDERTGQLRQMSSPSVILEGVICASRFRRACSRDNYLFWREIWLERAEPTRPEPAIKTAEVQTPVTTA